MRMVNIRTYLDNENFINFLCVLFFVCSIFFAALFTALHHQYKVIMSQRMAEEHENKVYILDLINLDLELITICQQDVYSLMSKGKKDEALAVECLKSPVDLNADINALPKYFNIDDGLRQKISAIVNRKNQLVLDQQSVLLTKQILAQLRNQLSSEAKPVKLPSYL